MNVAFQRNIGSFVRAVPAFANDSVVAGSGDDGVALPGLTIDRNQFVPVALSALVALHFNITDLGDDETVQIDMSAEDSANGSDWDDLDIGPPDSATVKTFTTDAVDAESVAQFKAQLGAARRYVRFNFTITLSASGTDTVAVRGAVAVIAGFDELPAADYVEPSVS